MTLPTLKWRLTGVGALVNYKCTSVGKILIAMLAFKRFLNRVEARVDTNVSYQTAALCKVFMTVTALIWPLTRVGTHVNTEGILL